MVRKFNFILNLFTLITFFSFFQSSYAQSEFNDAYEIYKSGNFKSSIQLLSELINKKDDRPKYKIYVYRGASYAFLGKFSEAYSDFLKAIEINSEDFLVYYFIGKYYSDLADL